MDKKDVERRAIKYEEMHGTDEFVKAALSAVTHLLVDKKICTEDELRASFIRELQRGPIQAKEVSP